MKCPVPSVRWAVGKVLKLDRRASADVGGIGAEGCDRLAANGHSPIATRGAEIGWGPDLGALIVEEIQHPVALPRRKHVHAAVIGVVHVVHRLIIVIVWRLGAAVARVGRAAENWSARRWRIANFVA